MGEKTLLEKLKERRARMVKFSFFAELHGVRPCRWRTGGTSRKRRLKPVECSE
jgi:hypothetical protein